MAGIIFKRKRYMGTVILISGVTGLILSFGGISTDDEVMIAIGNTLWMTGLIIGITIYI